MIARAALPYATPRHLPSSAPSFIMVGEENIINQQDEKSAKNISMLDEELLPAGLALFRLDRLIAGTDFF
jgi:hypothetical protein